MLDFAEKGTLQLDKLKHMVLDEVDRMLDMGFADTVDAILQYSYNKGIFKLYYYMCFLYFTR